MSQISDGDRTAMRQAANEFAENMRAGSFAGVAAHYTADATLMPPNAPAVNGHSAIQAFLESFPPISAFELRQVTVDGSGDLAFVHGTYAMTLTMPDGTAVPDAGKFIEIRRRQADGRWLMTHDIFNSDSPAP